MNDPVTAHVRRHLATHFADAGAPESASVTFLGVDRMEVLRFAGADGLARFVSLGCSAHPMVDPSQIAADPRRGPRAEVVATLRPAGPGSGWARSLAVLAAAPAVDGLVLVPDALVDLGQPLWAGAAFTAFLTAESDIADLPLPEPLEPVRFLAAVPITPTEAAWVRLKGAEAMREAWRQDGVDVTDPARPAARPR